MEEDDNSARARAHDRPSCHSSTLPLHMDSAMPTLPCSSCPFNFATEELAPMEVRPFQWWEDKLGADCGGGGGGG